MPKFFVEPSKISEEQIIIDTDDVNHILRVLRMDKGSVIDICDSCGYDYKGEIIDVTKDKIICSIVDKKRSNTEPKINVTLFQALPKASKMEYIIQKNVELGINCIVPVVMSHCVSKIDNSKDSKKKTDRWQKIAEAAAKQSGRGIIPKVCEPVSFDEAVDKLCLMDYPFAPYECEENNTLKDVIQGINGDISVGFIIGPEGGFAKAEIDKLHDRGIKSITLGKRILRTETAGEAVLSMIMYEADELV